MSHTLGVVVPDGRTFNQANGIDFTPRPGPLGGPNLVILHFDSLDLSPGARLEVPLGYGTDRFTRDSGANVWTRPIDPTRGPIAIRIVGGTGSARLADYGAGEPTVTAARPPGASLGSRSNLDPFLVTDPYVEPIYETRLECTPGFGWRNARCALPGITDSVRDRVRGATGCIVMIHHGGVGSCTGTLIADDLFLCARHCWSDASGQDVRSASVTFDYETGCDGRRPIGHYACFFKVVEEVASGRPPSSTNSVETDWVVLRLDAAPGTLPTPLPMRDFAPLAGETIFAMHHPNGAVKKTQQGRHAGHRTLVLLCHK